MNGISQTGFKDPVADSQAVFRAVLGAMARPGQIQYVDAEICSPAPLDRATAAVLLSLVDIETPLWLGELGSSVSDWIVFHSGASLSVASQSRFGVALRPQCLQDFAVGTEDEPENSATVILQVAELGGGESYRLQGPGIPSPELLAVRGLGEDFPSQWRLNNRLFPRGIDVILCADRFLTALPRTTRLEIA